MLELARRLKNLKHFVYASSSSVYGGNTKLPFSVDDPVEQPNSLYAATKRTDELFGYTYAHLYGIAATGLRFFTVYGPWGRPDMAAFLFTKAIIAGEPIKVFNHGEMWRDFTYIDDIVNGVVRVLDRPPADGRNKAVRRRTKSIIWAITNRKNSPISSPKSNAPCSARPSSSSNRSSRAMCPRPMPTSTPAAATWASNPPPPSASAFPNSSTGTRIITASIRDSRVAADRRQWPGRGFPRPRLPS